MTTTGETDGAGLGLLYTTFADEAQLEAFAAALLEARLAACINAFPAMRAFYRWAGELKSDFEVACLIKTRIDLKDAVLAFAKAHHPYETPALVWFESDSAGAAFAAWVAAETHP